MATKSAPASSSISEAEIKTRLLAAFPEIDLEQFIDEQGTNNRHNVEERFTSTVNSVFAWVKPASK